MASSVKGTVIPLSETISIADAERAARQVREEVDKQQEYLKELQSYRDENKVLSGLVTQLPDSVSHNVMVPFGKAAFFPGRLIHTNEFLVLLGERYYGERSSKQTVNILERRNEFLLRKISSVESQIADLEAEGAFASNTAAEAKAGVVEIREQILEESDKSFDQVPRITIRNRDDPNQDKSNFEGESSHAASLRSSHSSMDEDEEHKLIMARIEALEAAEEAAGRTSDEEDMSDEENISNDDELDAAEAITKSKSYLSKDQKATLLEKLNRSEAEDYDGEDSDEEDSMLGGSGSEEEYDIEEEDEESRAHNRFSSNQGAESIRTGQGKGVIEMPAEVSKKTRPLSRFAREFADSVKARTDSEHAQQPLVSQSRDTPAKKVSFAADKDTSCSGLEIPDMQGQNELQKLKDWRTQESSKQGFVLGQEAGKTNVVNPVNIDETRGQKMAQPTPGQTQAFTGTVTEHNVRSTVTNRAGIASEPNSRPTNRSGTGTVTDRMVKSNNQSDQQVEEQPSRPVSKFRQMRQAGGR
ncbi:unconventional prefoldin RPB5 interactor 1 [Marchantia polymorpha subsp. ruderalis]|uniref:RNA polymerase II subunit 5-mediating protein homolog n=2 Tax=Marchantia polymorpha TaxID=3197 RepID=A0AAF6BX38_MARPO|nr:hypothetical protein MARPO_0076s0049 [Marchantia polymorpha]BBN16572.1 hypothetical protein Mp_7g07450 [Marchantia polymorpha subsp. ruderalis]|eukprot:PTQ34806.1 hypothetical protein MARPO_0076s0049 [Marchantia polymorpha]